jgi:hypothetical protein
MMPCACRCSAAEATPSAIPTTVFRSNVASPVYTSRGARIKARRPGQIAEALINQRHDQPVGVIGMRLQLAEQRDQIRMRAGRHAGVHFVERQAIAGQFALEQLERHQLRALCSAPFGLVDDAGSALAQWMADLQIVPVNQRNIGRAGGVGTKWIAGKSQPREPRQRQQPFGQGRKLVGGNPQQLQPRTVHHFRRQRLQAVAGQHQLLQAGTTAEFRRQFADLVIGQDQPAQPGRQGIGRNACNAVGLEAEHFERRALADHGRQFGEGIIRAKQDAQLAQARQIVGQRSQRIARQIENLQRVCQIEDLAREFVQPAG